MLRALVGLASCLVPGRRRADKRKRDEDILDEALASRTTPPAGGGDAPPAAKRAAVERQPASQGQHQLQNGGMEQCFNTSATPGTSGGKRYGADLAGLQDFDSDGEQQHSSLQPRWEHAQDSHALKRKRPASAAAAGVLDGRPATPLAEAAAALRPTLERHPARANQQLAMQPRLQPEQRQSGAHLESKWADRILTGAAGRPPAAHQAVTGAPQAHPLPSFVKGQAVWYRQRDGTEEEAKVGCCCCCWGTCKASTQLIASPQAAGGASYCWRSVWLPSMVCPGSRLMPFASWALVSGLAATGDVGGPHGRASQLRRAAARQERGEGDGCRAAAALGPRGKQLQSRQ